MDRLEELRFRFAMESSMRSQLTVSMIISMVNGPLYLREVYQKIIDEDTTYTEKMFRKIEWVAGLQDKMKRLGFDRDWDQVRLSLSFMG